MRLIVLLLATLVATPALAQSVTATPDPIVGIIVPNGDVGQASAADASNPTTAWSLGLAPKMRRETDETASLPARCVQNPATVKAGDTISFGTCDVPLKDATQVHPKGQKGDDHSPPSTAVPK